MADIFRLFTLLLWLTISLSAYFLVLSALFPHHVDKTQRVFSQLTGRAFMLGLVNFLFFGVMGLFLSSVAENTDGLIKAILTIPALIIFGFLAILLSVGLTGVANVLGARLFPEHATWKQTAWGSVVLTLACALPFGGWFLLLPALGFVGIGGAILGFVQRSE
jgi:hypothetical protein